MSLLLTRRLFPVVGLLLLVLATLPPTPASAQTLVVTSTADAGAGTLRAAIIAANATEGPSTITFAIPGDGPHSIRLESALRLIGDGQTTIDGYTQPGASPNTDPLASNAVLQIEITGSSRGFQILSSGNTLTGLALYGFGGHHIQIVGEDDPDADYETEPRPGSGNRIVGNFIGTDATGTFTGVAPQQVDGTSGVSLIRGAARNLIGDTSPADRNVISGNATNGVELYFRARGMGNETPNGTDDNVIVNNVVGLAPDGTRALGNGRHGIDVNTGSQRNIVGGTGPGERNVVAASRKSGVEVSHGPGTLDNQVIGNYVGVDVNGRANGDSLANRDFGVRLEDGIARTTVADNVIANNLGGGLLIDQRSHLSFVRRNLVGLGPDGAPLPNENFGIQIALGARRNEIGPGNVIANNPSGIRLTTDPNADTSNPNTLNNRNTITRNSIYANMPGLGIDLHPIGQVNPNTDPDADPTAVNYNLNHPVIESAMPTEVTGTACAGCVVEVFVADRPEGQHGEGQTYAGFGVAGDDGQFTAAVSGITGGQVITATATDPLGNTSEFAENLATEPGPENPEPPDPGNPIDGFPLDPDEPDPDEPGTPVGPDDPPDPDPQPEPPVEPEIERLAGESRVQTAIAVSQAGFPDGSETVVLARTERYPDALAGGPLATAVDAPILLTPSAGLHPDTAAEIQRLGATRAYLLGGGSAISEEVESAVVDTTSVETTTRLGGATRFDTSGLIANELATVGGTESATAVYIAEGDNVDPARGWPDALSVSALAGHEGRPILLTLAGTVPAATLATLDELGAETATVVGGTAAVSDDAAAMLQNAGLDVERVGGENRYDTSRLLADRSVAAGLSPARPWLATGLDWPDALSGGPGVARDGGVLLLVHGFDLMLSAASREWVSDHADDIELVRLLGGTAAITAEVEAAIAALLP